MPTQVKEFYKGRCVFLTGASGFMGKVLIEKMLYTIPDIGKIYILVRPKRGKSVEKRMEDMWKSPMFQRLRDEKPSSIQKVCAIQGDVLFENLGMDAAILENIKNEVSIIFHFAATLKLEAAMKDAINMNTSGTRRVLDIAKKVKNLDLFVHLSTAFCYPDYDKLDEKFHDPPVNPYDLMRICEWMDEKQLALITPRLLGAHPNCYTYSKRLAEALVNEAYSEIPVVIVRPSIVCPAFKEPLPGWVDNLNGPIGVMIGAGKGVIRTMLCDGDLYAQVIPVDYAINAVITLTQIEATKREKATQIPVYNLTNGKENKETWRTVLNIGKEFGRKNPFEWPLWYPNGDITTNKLVHETNKFLFHIVPAYFIDFLLMIFAQKRFMVRIQNRISLGLEVLQYFTTRQWDFENKNFLTLPNKLSEEDNKVYYMDVMAVKTKPYIETCVTGGRLYCLKEPLSNIPRARMTHNVMFVLDIFCKALFFYMLIYLLISYSETVNSIYSYGYSLVKKVPLLGSEEFKDRPIAI